MKSLPTHLEVYHGVASSFSQQIYFNSWDLLWLWYIDFLPPQCLGSLDPLCESMWLPYHSRPVAVGRTAIRRPWCCCCVRGLIPTWPVWRMTRFLDQSCGPKFKVISQREHLFLSPEGNQTWLGNPQIYIIYIYIYIHSNIIMYTYIYIYIYMYINRVVSWENPLSMVRFPLMSRRWCPKK